MAVDSCQIHALSTTTLTRPMGQSAGVDRASKPPSRHRCLLLALADVELRCCLQWLPLRDALHFARCNTRTRAVAEDPQGWAGSMLRFDFSCPPPGPLHHIPLLRHVWTAVRWPGIHAHLDSTSFERLLHMTPQRVREWDLSRSELSGLQWTRILLDPRAKQLTALHMHWRDRTFIDTAVLGLVTKLPQLRTLSVAPIEGVADCWSMLADAPALSSLAIQDTIDDSRLPFVAACPHLTSLHLLRPSLSGDKFLAFFSSPNLRRCLRCLELEGFAFQRPVSAQTPFDQLDDVALAFKGLECLESLTLCEVHASDWIMPALYEVKSLRRVVIQPISNSSPQPFGSPQSFPPPLSIMHLLAQAPQLERVVLRVPVNPPTRVAASTYHEYCRCHDLQPGGAKARTTGDGSIPVRPNLPSDRFWIEWIPPAFHASQPRGDRFGMDGVAH